MKDGFRKEYAALTFHLNSLVSLVQPLRPSSSGVTAMEQHCAGRFEVYNQIELELNVSIAEIFLVHLAYLLAHLLGHLLV